MKGEVNYKPWIACSILFTKYAINIFKKDYSTNGLFSLRYNYMALRLLKITLAEDI